jgi:hypothetical protein
VNGNNANENDSIVHSVNAARSILNNNDGNEETTHYKTGVNDANENDSIVHSVNAARSILNNNDDIRESARAQLRSLPEKTSVDHSLQPYTESERSANENNSTVHAVDTARAILNNGDQVSVDSSIPFYARAIALVYGLQDYVIVDESLPLGYLIDVPSEFDFSDAFEDHSELRCAFWFLVTVSQQLTIPVDELPKCAWRSLREHDQEQFELFCCATLGAPFFEDGNLFMNMPAMIFWMMKQNTLVSLLLGGGGK